MTDGNGGGDIPPPFQLIGVIKQKQPVIHRSNNGAAEWSFI